MFSSCLIIHHAIELCLLNNLKLNKNHNIYIYIYIYIEGSLNSTEELFNLIRLLFIYVLQNVEADIKEDVDSLVRVTCRTTHRADPSQVELQHKFGEMLQAQRLLWQKRTQVKNLSFRNQRLQELVKYLSRSVEIGSEDLCQQIAL